MYNELEIDMRKYAYTMNLSDFMEAFGTSRVSIMIWESVNGPSESDSDELDFPTEDGC